MARLDNPGPQWESDDAMWSMGADGVFTIREPQAGEVKRLRITPPAATNIGTMIARAGGR